MGGSDSTTAGAGQQENRAIDLDQREQHNAEQSPRQQKQAVAAPDPFLHLANPPLVSSSTPNSQQYAARLLLLLLPTPCCPAGARPHRTSRWSTVNRWIDDRTRRSGRPSPQCQVKQRDTVLPLGHLLPPYYDVPYFGTWIRNPRATPHARCTRHGQVFTMLLQRLFFILLLPLLLLLLLLLIWTCTDVRAGAQCGGQCTHAFTMQQGASSASHARFVPATPAYCGICSLCGCLPSPHHLIRRPLRACRTGGSDSARPWSPDCAASSVAFA